MKKPVYLVLAFLVAVCTQVKSDPVIALDPLVDYRYTGNVVRDSSGATKRSSATIYAFRKLWACPATGLKTGACPGWAIDHVVPLDCGGVDAVYNMQWLPNQIKSTMGPYSKDRFERRIYGKHNVSVGCP